MPKSNPTQDSLPPPQSNKGGTFRHLRVVVGVAIVLATLFTAWTPGKFLSEEDPGASIIAAPLPVQPQATTTSPGSPTNTPRPGPIVGIVAGHWGNDSGAVCNDGLREVDINLNIASLAQKYLSEQGFTVDLLKEFDSRLHGYQAHALLSIHADSCDFINDQATGFKVAAALGSKFPERATRLTACLRSRYALFTGLPLHSTSVTLDMTSYHAFGEVNENTPAAIIETGFMNLDRQILTQTPEVVAQGIVSGILCYINNESITLPSPQPTP